MKYVGELSVEVGSEVCFTEGKKEKPVAYTPLGKVILCKHDIPLGYAKIKTIEYREKCLLVTADHIVKDIYPGIDYYDFIKVLPLHGFKIGFDNLFPHEVDGKEIMEHQIYAYNLKNNAIIVAETIRFDESGRWKFNSIVVDLVGTNIFQKYDVFLGRKLFYYGSKDHIALDLVRLKNPAEPLKNINILMAHTEIKPWPKEDFPYLWTYADNDVRNENGDWTVGKASLIKLLDAPESLQIFEGCDFLENLKRKGN